MRRHYRDRRRNRNHLPHYVKLNFLDSMKKYGFWNALTYRIKKSRISIWYFVCFIAMIILALLQQFFTIKIVSIDLSFFFYIFEIIVVGYVIFWLLKKFDRISIHNDMRLFGLRILSGILSFVGIYFLFIFLMFGLPVIMSNSSWTREMYQFMGLGIFYSLFSFGSDFGLPLTGVVLYIGLMLGLALIGGYLFFKFQRRTGRFVWFGRI